MKRLVILLGLLTLGTGCVSASAPITPSAVVSACFVGEVGSQDTGGCGLTGELCDVGFREVVNTKHNSLNACISDCQAVDDAYRLFPQYYQCLPNIREGQRFCIRWCRQQEYPANIGGNP